MNKRGGVLLMILFSIFIFMVGVLFMNLLKDDVTSAKTNLSCSSSSTISDGTKLACIIVGGVIPYFIIMIISLAGGLLLDSVLK